MLVHLNVLAIQEMIVQMKKLNLSLVVLTQSLKVQHIGHQTCIEKFIIYLHVLEFYLIMSLTLDQIILLQRKSFHLHIGFQWAL